MPVIVVANPKGGVGKSTLSSNIAGYYARQGHSVMLGDVDRQQSSRLWLKLRPANMPQIQSWDITEDHIARPPKGTTHEFLADLSKRKRADKTQLAVVGNRIKDHTKATEHLKEFLQTLDIPLVTLLRDTQNYAHLAAHGLSLWDVAAHKVEKDTNQWAPLLKWLGE
jgi:chromosome partitioning protein